MAQPNNGKNGILCQKLYWCFPLEFKICFHYCLLVIFKEFLVCFWCKYVAGLVERKIMVSHKLKIWPSCQLCLGNQVIFQRLELLTNGEINDCFLYPTANAEIMQVDLTPSSDSKLGVLFYWRLSWIWNIISVFVAQEDILPFPFLFPQQENFFEFNSLNKPAGRHLFLKIVSWAIGSTKAWRDKWKWNHWLFSTNSSPESPFSRFLFLPFSSYLLFPFSAAFP